MYAYIVIRTIGYLKDVKAVCLSYSKAQIEASRMDEATKLKGYKGFEFIIETHLITS